MPFMDPPALMQKVQTRALDQRLASSRNLAALSRRSGYLEQAQVYRNRAHPRNLASKATVESYTDTNPKTKSKKEDNHLRMNLELQDALCKQATAELAASNTYLAASFWFTQRHFDGIAAYFRKESDDERTHSLSIFDYVHKRTEGVGTIHEVPAPKQHWDDPKQVFNDLFALEKKFYANFKVNTEFPIFDGIDKVNFGRISGNSRKIKMTQESKFSSKNLLRNRKTRWITLRS